MATIVWVPGSFAPAPLYEGFAKRLRDNDIDVRIVPTRSVGRWEGKPPGTVSDDVKAIEEVAAPVLDEGKDIVLVAHSYGGIPSSESLKSLAAKNRGGKGVTRIVYISAVILQPGVSNLELFGGQMPPFVKKEDDYMSLDLDVVGPLTWSDFPEDEARKFARGMSVHSTASFNQKATYAGYNDVEVHYVLCEDDKIVPPEFQAGFIEMMKASSGKEPVVHKLKSDHCPSDSHPEELLEILKGIIRSG